VVLRPAPVAPQAEHAVVRRLVPRRAVHAAVLRAVRPAALRQVARAPHLRRVERLLQWLACRLSQVRKALLLR
jgi:hypothetical protein